MSHLDANDVVVAELDVVVSNQLASLATQLVMLQQPLRPNWRPYNTDRSGISARFKPQARRLEMALPLDTRGENYGDCAEAHKKISSLTLRSTAVEDAGGCACAIGVVREQQLLLLPLDYTLQLRPDMSYLNAESAKQRKEGEESEEEDVAEEPLTAVEVTVKRLDDALGGAGAAAAAAAAGTSSAAAGGTAAAAAALGDAVTAELSQAMDPIIKALAQRHPVCSMANVRQWLQQQGGEEPLAKQAAQLSDALLDALVAASGHVLCIRRMYVAKAGTTAATEGLRKVIVGLLTDKATLRKADVFGAAEAAGLSPTESQYQKVMRELCRNNGNHWTIKTTADM
ncbi:hypothetical protein OEZ86_001177 [Tetradesmus obliquus]|nr:hypothetical protein OEZ86_001177 [Tetradesmus obliquus]